MVCIGICAPSVYNVWRKFRVSPLQRRWPGRGFFVPGFSREGEKSMSLTELMDASKGLTNMALAHEIAVDKDFSLQKIQPANEVEKQVS